MGKEQLVMGCIAQQLNFRGCWDIGWHEIIACRAFGEADFSKICYQNLKEGKIQKADISKSVRIGHF